jgi:hypothetical protein
VREKESVVWRESRRKENNNMMTMVMGPGCVLCLETGQIDGWRATGVELISRTYAISLTP